MGALSLTWVTAVVEFDYSQFANQAQRLMQLVNKAHARSVGHEPTIDAFRAELSGDRESFEVLKARAQRDTPEDLALLTSLFLRAILRRNAALASAALAGVEAIVAEGDEHEVGGELAAS